MNLWASHGLQVVLEGHLVALGWAVTSNLCGRIELILHHLLVFLVILAALCAVGTEVLAAVLLVQSAGPLANLTGGLFVNIRVDVGVHPVDPPLFLLRAAISLRGGFELSIATNSGTVV